MRVKQSVGLMQKAQLISASFLFVFRLKKKSFKVRNRIKLYPCYSLCTLCRRNLQRSNFPTLLMVTLIRRENRAFRKRSSNCRNWKTMPLRLRVDKNHFENLRFSKTIIITVIMWFPWPSFLQTRILNKGWDAPRWLFEPYGDVPLNRLCVFGLAVIKRVHNLICHCPKQGQNLS